MTLVLAARLDTAAADPLRHALLAMLGRGEALALDGGAVERAGLACLQVLAAARAAAIAGGTGYRVAQPGAALAGMAGLAGLDAVLAPA